MFKPRDSQTDCCLAQIVAQVTDDGMPPLSPDAGVQQLIGLADNGSEAEACGGPAGALSQVVEEEQALCTEGISEIDYVHSFVGAYTAKEDFGRCTEKELHKGCGCEVADFRLLHRLRKHIGKESENKRQFLRRLKNCLRKHNDKESDKKRLQQDAQKQPKADGKPVDMQKLEPAGLRRVKFFCCSDLTA